MAFLKEYFEKVDCEKNQQMTKKHEKLLSMQRIFFCLQIFLELTYAIFFMNSTSMSINLVPSEFFFNTSIGRGTLVAGQLLTTSVKLFWNSDLEDF